MPVTTTRLKGMILLAPSVEMNVDDVVGLLPRLARKGEAAHGTADLAMRHADNTEQDE